MCPKKNIFTKLKIYDALRKWPENCLPFEFKNNKIKNFCTIFH